VHAKLLSDRMAMSNPAKIFCLPGPAIKTNQTARKAAGRAERDREDLPPAVRPPAHAQDVDLAVGIGEAPNATQVTRSPCLFRALWLRGHIAHYREGIPGHAGELRELAGQSG